jgi:nitric oxide reductase NorQ protein
MTTTGTSGILPKAASGKIAAGKPRQERIDELHAKLEERLRGVTGESEQEIVKEPRTLGAGIPRPNGDLYYPRLIGDAKDVDVLRQLRDASIYVLLSGPPGGGKSSLAEAAFGTEIHYVMGNENTAVESFQGGWTSDGPGTWRWSDGPLTTAMKCGEVLFIDDATLIHPNVMASVYSAIDGRREIILADHVTDGRQEVVTAADGFYVIAAHNPGTPGAILAEALASRFTFQLDVGTDLDLAASLGVPARFVKLARNLATAKDNDSVFWVPQMRELLAARDICALFGEKIAAQNLAGLAPLESRDVVIDTIARIFAIDGLTPLSLGEQA